jgi:hypothetical protein
MDDYLITKINDMNHKFYQIFTNIDRSIPLSDQFDLFFSEYDNFNQGLLTHKTSNELEIPSLKLHLSNTTTQHLQVLTEFNSKLTEFKRNVSDMFGKDISDIIIMSHGNLKFYKSTTNGRFTESDYKRIEEIFIEKKEDRNTINRLSLSVSNINDEITKTQNRIHDINIDIIKMNKSTEMIKQFILYYKELIVNAQDVVIITNENSRLYQVTVISTDQLFTKKIVYADPSEWFNPITRADFPKAEIDMACQTDQVPSVHRPRENECLPVLSDILDVFDEDEDYYYGICTGVRVLTRKDNCVKIEQPERCTLPYFVMNNHFARKLLLKDLTLDQLPEKNRLVLFEHRKYHLLQSSSFQTYHGHWSDEVFGRPPACCMSSSDNKSYGDDAKNIITLPIQNMFDDNHRLYRYERDIFKIFIFNNLLRLLRSNNSFYRSCALQNFKYLFTHSPDEEIELYNNINEHLHDPHNWDFRLNIKLIDLFIPEIKFLMHRILYDKLKIPDRLQMEWEKYVAEHNKPPETKPQNFLHYLLNVVLSNLVSRKLHRSLLSKLGEITIALTRDMTSGQSVSNRGQYKMIIDMIERVIQYELKQEGGIRTYKKNISRKKPGRKLLNNKISNRQKKISRKHTN